jgi:serine/threonine-protein kinase RsbW
LEARRQQKRALFWTCADSSRLAEIAAFLRRALSNLAGYRDRAEERYLIELAAVEACTNVIRYAYRNGPPGRIGLSVRPRGNGLEILVLDRGAPFDPTEIPRPDLANPGEGGYGVFLMREIMSEVRYERRGGRWNCLYLIRKEPAQEAGGSATVAKANSRGRLPRGTAGADTEKSREGSE